jgi:hypothetical protein
MGAHPGEIENFMREQRAIYAAWRERTAERIKAWLLRGGEDFPAGQSRWRAFWGAVSDLRIQT